MTIRKILTIAAAAVLVAAAAVSAAPAAPAAPPAPRFLKGKVTAVPETPTLASRVDAARAEFGRSSQGDLFFTAHLFPSRETIHHTMNGSHGPFAVTVQGEDIEFRGDRNEENFNSREGTSPAGLLLLHTTKGGDRALTAQVLDPEAVYDFKTVPVYWLGATDADSSLGYLQAEFERGAERLRKSLVFASSLHDSPRALDFLRKVALGTAYGLEVRKDAVFWTGNARDPRSIAILKEVFEQAKENDLKKHVIFALTLPDSREAVAELIRIARTDREQEVRKDAIFWLGQKATKEAGEALQGIVNTSDENDQVKESAVFAISQLPKEKSVPLLVSMARENKSLAVRKKALFWLGQTDSDEALKLFEEILMKKGK